MIWGVNWKDFRISKRQMCSQNDSSMCPSPIRTTLTPLKNIMKYFRCRKRHNDNLTILIYPFWEIVISTEWKPMCPALIAFMPPPTQEPYTEFGYFYFRAFLFSFTTYVYTHVYMHIYCFLHICQIYIYVKYIDMLNSIWYHFIYH